MRASSELQFGARETGGTVVESLLNSSALSGGYAPDSARAEGGGRSQGNAEPRSARIKDANREVSEGKADL